MPTAAVEPRQRRAQATKQRLLAAAAQELVERDGALEVATVAARADVSPGLIYRYFESRAGLLAAVVDAFYDRLDSEIMLIDPAPGADWATREKARLGLVVDLYYDEPLAPVVLARLRTDPAVAAVEARRVGAHVKTAARNVKRAQDAGQLPAGLDPRIAGAMTLGGIRMVLADVMARARRPRRSTVHEQLWSLVAASVSRAAPERPV